MKILTLTIWLLLLPQPSTSLPKRYNTNASNDKIYQIMEVDFTPTFKGGYNALLTYLNANLTYPAIYNDANIQGRVICSFIIAENGSISNVKVIQGLDKTLDEEVVKVLKSMPQWVSGKRKGRAVKIEYFLPVECKIK